MADMDLFGRALMDRYKGKRYKLYMERDDGLMDEQNMDFYFNDFEKFPGAETKALKHAKGKVLDLGVGAGRAALYLQGRGCEVLGIDISDKALEVCRLRGVKTVKKMSVCDLKLPKNSFDCAISLFNNFGLCGSMDGVAGMMRQLHRIIKGDGIFLAESVDPTDTKKRSHLKYHKRNTDRGDPPGLVTLRTHYRGHIDGWWDLLLLTPSEVRELCDRTGWKVWRTFRGGPMIVYALKKA
jgi:SAM-dependent methyltransferase